MASVDLSDDERRRQYEDFVSRNPGDEGRASSALGFDTSDLPQQTSQSQMRAPTNDGGTNDGPGSDNGGGGGDNSGGGAPSGPSAYSYNPGDINTGNPYVDGMINRDRGSWEKSLREAAAAKGVQYDPTDLQGLIRQVSYAQNAGKDPLEFINAQKAIYASRAGNTPAGPIVPPNDPRTRTTSGPPPPFNNGTNNPQPTNLWGNQFNDPYTVQLEDLIKSQLTELQKPITDPNRDQLGALLQRSLDRNQNNPQMDRLLAYLDQQFKTRSETPGYTADERALMNTQALEPIEALRNASRQREMERTSQAGYLPTSGIANERMSNADRYYDQLRTVANRDLSIKNIDQSRADQNEALSLGQLGVKLPQQQDAQGIDIASLLAQLSQASRTEDQSRQGQAVNLATQLYQLPINAQNQALNIINGTGNPSQGINSLIQLQQLQNQQRAYSDAANADIYRAIGQYLGQFLG